MKTILRYFIWLMILIVVAPQPTAEAFQYFGEVAKSFLVETVKTVFSSAVDAAKQEIKQEINSKVDDVKQAGQNMADTLKRNGQVGQYNKPNDTTGFANGNTQAKVR